MRAFIDGMEIPLSESFIEYSLEERVVGQWIDGKPIYQKTFIIENVIGGYHNITNEIPFDKLVSSESVNTTADGAVYNAYNVTSIGIIDGYLKAWYSSSSALKGGSAYVTACYTKTTDQATIDVTPISTQSFTEFDPMEDVYKELAAGDDTPEEAST